MMFTTRLLVVVLLTLLALAGCSAKHNAPIVEGWHQPAAKTSAYVVQKGDTLYSVAWAFDMDFRDLARINQLSPPYALRTGQRLQMSPNSYVNVTKLTTTKYGAKTIPQPPALKFYSAPKTKTKIAATKTVPPQPIITPNVRVGQWLWPSKGKILRGYAPARTGNRGIDIGGNYGDPIMATASGRVVYAGSGLKGYGNLIIVKHNDTFLSAYAYNKTLLVREGMAVKAGQKIALMGKNNAGLPAMHFEIRRNGKPVNPLTLLKG